MIVIGLMDTSRLAKEEIEDLDPRVSAKVGYGMDAGGGRSRMDERVNAGPVHDAAGRGSLSS